MQHDLTFDVWRWYVSLSPFRITQYIAHFRHFCQLWPLQYWRVHLCVVVLKSYYSESYDKVLFHADNFRAWKPWKAPIFFILTVLWILSDNNNNNNNPRDLYYRGWNLKKRKNNNNHNHHYHNHNNSDANYAVIFTVRRRKIVYFVCLQHIDRSVLSSIWHRILRNKRRRLSTAIARVVNIRVPCHRALLSACNVMSSQPDTWLYSFHRPISWTCVKSTFAYTVSAEDVDMCRNNRAHHV